MPGMSGVDFLKKAIDKYPELNRILVTAYPIMKSFAKQ
jgi:two-component SAPR family response regulator